MFNGNNHAKVEGNLEAMNRVLNSCIDRNLLTAIEEGRIRSSLDEPDVPYEYLWQTCELIQRRATAMAMNDRAAIERFNDWIEEFIPESLALRLHVPLS